MADDRERSSADHDDASPAPERAHTGSVAPHLITRQRIAPEKLALAKRLRTTMTPEEATLWQHLRANRFHGLAFRRQQIIGGFIVDFYCAAARLVVEVDGPVHNRQVDYDAARDDVLAAHGVRILRVRNEAVRFDLASVLTTIRNACVA